MSEHTTSNQLTLSAEDFPAKTYLEHSMELVLDWLENEADFGMSSQELLMKLSLNGLSLKIYHGYSRPTMGEILPPLFQRWLNSGMAFVGGYWTQNSLELLEQEEDCLLSDVLETSGVHPKYYLDQTKSAQWFRQNKPQELLNRCALDGMEGCHLKDLDSVFLRKLTPLEQERIMGFPDNWTNLDTEHSVTQ